MSSKFLHNENLENLVSDLQRTNWEEHLIGNLNEKFENFEKILNSLYCKNFPLKTKYLSSKRLSKPWLTRELLDLIEKKSNYCKLYRMGIISKEVNNSFKNRVCSIVKKRSS